MDVRLLDPALLRDDIKSLLKAALSGNIEEFWFVFHKNPDVLEDVAVTISDTPLHIAARFGHLDFVRAILSIKPSFAWELNQDGFSPMNLASENGHVGIVKELLAYDPELHMLKDRDGRTPLHCSAICGRIEILNELLMNFNDCLEEVTARGETALHLAIKNNQEEAFIFLMDWVKRTQKEKLLDWKDKAGNTVLQLAGTKKIIEANPEAIKMLSMDMSVLGKESKVKPAKDFWGGFRKSIDFIRQTKNNWKVILKILPAACKLSFPFKSSKPLFEQHGQNEAHDIEVKGMLCEDQDLHAFNQEIVEKLPNILADQKDESCLSEYYDLEARNKSTTASFIVINLAVPLLLTYTQPKELQKTVGFEHIVFHLLVVFSMIGIISAVSAILLNRAGLPRRQNFLLIISVLSTVSSYACAIAIYSPVECLRAPFLVVAFLGVVYYYVVLLQKKEGFDWGTIKHCYSPVTNQSNPCKDMEDDTVSFT